jgi:putative ABC transport system permease protein
MKSNFAGFLTALDFKIGFRMLKRYPGLTIVGTIAIAVAIALGTLYFEAIDKYQNPRLPVANAGRIVSIRNWDVNEFRTEGRMVNDFAIWKREVKTVENLGAAIQFMRNLATDDGRVEPVRGAEVTANAFRLIPNVPLLGRALTERDESPAEPPVIVISATIWEARFARDPAVIGKTVKLGSVNATIVGVMPEEFGFPVAERVWTPLRTDGATLEPRSGPGVSVFGRLAPGKSIDDARAEMSVLGARMSASNPQTHQHLRPRVTTYARPLNEGGTSLLMRNIMYTVNVIFLLLLSIMCANVATLVFARTATRTWEITVRSALGASRGRIIAQLFSEALVLAALATVVGLVLARVSLRYGLQMMSGNESLPFWIDASISWRTMLYAAGLAVFGAAIIGILPALRVTRVNINDMLRSEAAGRAGLRFGGFWTAVIIVQVAITVAFLPIAGGGVFESNRFNQRAEGIGAERFVMADVTIDRENHGIDSAAFTARARQSFDRLEERLAAEPGVERVTFVDRVPVEDQFKYSIEVDTAMGAPKDGLRTSTLVHAGRGYFNAFGTRVVAGRDFQSLDYETRNVIIVNEAFARHVFGQRNAVGQRVRIMEGEISRDATKEWLEIVGVVSNFGWQLPQPQEQSAMYRPTLATANNGMNLVLRVQAPEEFPNRLRSIAAAVDPTIRLEKVQPLALAGGGEAEMNWALTSVAWVVGFIVLLLSATGIHALMAFTVARRTREIGIRAALGARPGRIVAGIFSRAFLQIGAGVVLGSALASIGGLQGRQLGLLIAADAIMLVVGLTACALPVRRALSIDPTEALRAEG